MRTKKFDYLLRLRSGLTRRRCVIYHHLGTRGVVKAVHHSGQFKCRTRPWARNGEFFIVSNFLHLRVVPVKKMFPKERVVIHILWRGLPRSAADFRERRIDEILQVYNPNVLCVLARNLFFDICQIRQCEGCVVREHHLMFLKDIGRDDVVYWYLIQ